MPTRGISRLLVFLACLVAPLAAHAAVTNPGKWTQATRWRRGLTPSDTGTLEETAVSLMLLALPDSAGQTQARVLWFHDDHPGLHQADPHFVYGGFWDWRAPSDSLLRLGYFPDTSQATGSLRAGRFPSPGYHIFCSTLAQLDDDAGYGRALVVAGTSEAENGSREARIYDSRTNSWQATANTLAVGRWYPSVVGLPTSDNRKLVLSGSRFKEMYLFSGATLDSNVYRLAVSHSPESLGTVVPAPWTATDRRPVPRRGLTSNWSSGATEVYFGGMDAATGDLLNDYWLLRPDWNVAGDDYAFKWEKKHLAPLSQQPSPRAFHSAAMATGDVLIISGGQLTVSADGGPTNQIWTAALNGAGQVVWTLRTPTADSDAFPARFGHAAYYHKNFHRTFVYGGTGGLTAAPSDPDVYAMELVGVDEVRIKRCAVQGGSVSPTPRAYFASGPIERRIRQSLLAPSDTMTAAGLCVYGGRTGTTAASASAELYVAWFIDSVTVRWQLVNQEAAVGSSLPDARSFASGTGAMNTGEFFLAGGLDAAGNAREDVYSFHAMCSDPTLDVCPSADFVAMWENRASLGHPVWGHSLQARVDDTFARIAESYDPATNSFTSWPNTTLLQDWYPQLHVIPGSGAGRIFSPGPGMPNASSGSYNSWRLDVATGAWSLLPLAGSSFRGGSSVQYRPGKVMKCGTRDTDVLPYPPLAIGTTATIDITANSPAWAASGAMALGRVNFNLVMLPDGNVLATGGTGWRDNQDNLLPRRRPEIWDPTLNNNAGAWQGAGLTGVQLDTSTVARTYHSTAVLLPDGRVLCSGGNAHDRAAEVGQPWRYDQFKTDIYSPPYLFTAEGDPALRPTLRSAPRHVVYGQEFVVSVGGSDEISAGCLIRAGATTHGYDQSQLYVPLSFTRVGPIGIEQRYYQTTVPTDPATAPPGEYLLFVLNANGTPGVARWVHVGHTAPDAGYPTRVTDLTRECADTLGVVRLHWTAPGSDIGSLVPVRVSEYDVRSDTLWMTGDTAGELVPAEVGPGQPLVAVDHARVAGLTYGRTYYFRLRAKNTAGHWSEWSDQMAFTVLNEECGGSGGGGGGGGGGYYEGDFSRHGDMRFSATYRNPGGSSPDSSWLENTLLPNVALNVTKRDRIRLPFGPRWTESGARVRLSRSGSRSTHFDAVRLLAVDYAEGEGTFLAGGELVGGVTHDPFRVTHADGRDLTDLFVSGGAFEGHEGDTLYADLGADGPGSLVLTASKALLVRAPDRTGIDLASEVGGEWTDVGHHEVRAHASDEVFAAPNARRVRLAFRGPHRLEGLGRFTPGAPLTVTAYEPAAAEHSRLGEVTAAFAAEGEGTTLASGDQLLADFAASPAPDGTRREWYLEVTGAHMEGGGGVQAAKLASLTAPPASFALLRNRPNPFTGTTTLGFDVPRRTHVRLEVFDITGRRVAMLANRDYEPGRFTLEWDGRTSSGTRAAAGVYLYRMTAGAFREQRHMVLVR